MPRKTKFVTTTIPDTAQYKRAKWDGYQAPQKNMTLEAAMAHAMADPAVTYFFHTRGAMTLESSETNPTRTFESNEKAFFTGEDLWLGGAPGLADTYLFAEVYDTSDAETCQDILAELRKDFLIDALDTATPASTTKTVTAGIVFVDFKDCRGANSDIPALREKLINPPPPTSSGGGPGAAAESALQAFVRNESNQRVVLKVETYGSDSGPTWVSLADDHTVYQDDYDKIAQAVDDAVAFPDGWDITIFAFPETAGAADRPYRIGRSRCDAGRLVDVVKETGSGQKMQWVFMDPSHYADKLGALRTTTHELMHALKLVDLYYMGTFRSFGWSLMSAAGAGWHITNYEKLLLGWDDPANFIFLKRGIVPADDLLVAGGTKKAVVVLPDPAARRDDVYVIERAQEIGRDKNDFSALGVNDSLLLMIVRADRQEGIMIPYVCRRPATVIDAENKYGGASLAPYTAQRGFSTNGVFSFSTPGYTTNNPAGKKISRVVGVDGGYRPPARAKVLRENERLVAGTAEFGVTTSGFCRFGGGTACVDDAGNLFTFDPHHRDYGFAVYVDRRGIVHVAEAVDDKPTADAVRRTVDVSAEVSAALPADQDYVLTVETEDGKACLVVYQIAAGQAPQRKYVALRAPKFAVTPGRVATDGDYAITYGTDGNVTVFRGDSFLFGTRQVLGMDERRDGGDPDYITFGDKGEMRWWRARGRYWLPSPDYAAYRKWSGKDGTGPFTFGVEVATAKRVDLVVRDSAKVNLYTVCSRLDRGWTTQDGDYAIKFGDLDGNIALWKGDKFLAGSRQVFGMTVDTDAGDPEYLTFSDRGDLHWWRGQTAYRSFPVTTAGIGPFILGADPTAAGGCNVVVKDGTGKVLGTVFTYAAAPASPPQQS